jgi:pyruvate/2-oxoglutarate dehydrogenase complex dihydrolipoamide acyltransferase (E2) component
MIVPIKIPKLGMTMAEGTLIEWLVADGDEVAEGDPLYTLATDKTENEVDAPASGRVRIVGKPDQEYAVGDQIGEIES